VYRGVVRESTSQGARSESVDRISVCVCVYVRVCFNVYINLQFMRAMLADLFAF